MKKKSINNSTNYGSMDDTHRSHTEEENKDFPPPNAPGLTVLASFQEDTKPLSSPNDIGDQTPLGIAHNIFNIPSSLNTEPYQLVPEQPTTAIRVRVALGDYTLLEELMRRRGRINRAWPRNRHPTQWSLTYQTNIFLDNHYIRRRFSYMPLIILFITLWWTLYDRLNANVYFRDKYYPAFSAVDKEDHLFFITNLSRVIFLSLIATGLGAVYYIGQRQDERANRRANRHLIDYLIAKQCLVNVEAANKNLTEYKKNFEILVVHLPLYFDALLSQDDDWEAVIAVILSVAEYIHKNNITGKLEKEERAQAKTNTAENKISEPHSDNEIDSISEPNQQAAQLSIMAALQTKQAIITTGNSGPPNIVFATTHTRQLLKEYGAIFTNHGNRLHHLEQQLLPQPHAKEKESPITADYVRTFPAKLLYRIKCLMRNKELTFYLSPTKRAWILSTLFLDVYFQENIQKTSYINAFFSDWRGENGTIIPEEKMTKDQKSALAEDVETFGAMPVSHQSLIITQGFLGIGLTFFWHDLFTPSQRNLLLTQLCENNITFSRLLSLIIGNQQEDFTPESAARMASFCKLYPKTAGMIFLKLLDNAPNEKIIKFIFDVFWNSAINNDARKALIFSIEQSQPTKSLYLFGYNHVQKFRNDINVIDIIVNQQALILLGSVITECFFVKLSNQQKLIDNMQAKDSSANVILLQAGIQPLLNAAYQLITVLLKAPANQLTHLVSQKHLLAVLRIIMQFNQYYQQFPLWNNVLSQFFDAPSQFDLRLAPQLAEICADEKVTIKTIFNNLGRLDRAMVKRLAAVLIYAYYQAGKPGFLRSICCGKQSQTSCDRIEAVYTTININSCTPLKDYFTAFGLNNFDDQVNQAMLGYHYQSLQDIQDGKQPLNQSSSLESL